MKELTFHKPPRHNVSTAEQLEKFMDFLMAKDLPEGKRKPHHQPRLAEKQAFEVIMYLQETLPLIPDRFERCDCCGTIYDSWGEGIYWESKGKCFCGACDWQVPENYDRGKR